MSRTQIVVLCAVALSVATAIPGRAARPIYLHLQIDGNDIQGDSTVASLERADTIECLSFEYSVNSPRDPASGMATGRRTHGPITITKRIDRSSPLLIRALANNEVVSGVFRFFGSAGGGAEQEIYRVEIEDAWISSIRQFQRDVLTPEPPVNFPQETVTFGFRTIRFIWADGGVMFQDGQAQTTSAPANPADRKTIRLAPPTKTRTIRPAPGPVKNE